MSKIEYQNVPDNTKYLVAEFRCWFEPWHGTKFCYQIDAVVSPDHVPPSGTMGLQRKLVWSAAADGTDDKKFVAACEHYGITIKGGIAVGPDHVPGHGVVNTYGIKKFD